MMVLISMLLPLGYIVITTSAVSLCFKRRPVDVLAFSFFAQILLMLITAMVFKSLEIGIIIYLLLAALTYIVFLIKKSVREMRAYFSSLDFIESMVFILIIYLFIYVANYGTYFLYWDEFSHWGMFAKEMYRLDVLYCASPVTMAHKDYVPAISIFETLWCRLSLRYSDANAYRGIQILQASMLIPMVSSLQLGGINRGFKKIKNYCIRIVIVFGGLLLFGNLYHTVYQDIIYGVLVFFCMYVIITEKKALYKSCILSVSLTVLVMSKMTAMVFLPMIVLFSIAWRGLFESDSNKESISSLKKFTLFLYHLIIPLVFWVCYKYYVDSFITTSGGQSYNGLAKQLLKLWGNAQDYQKEVLGIYIKALFIEGVFLRIPFVFVIVAIIILVHLIKRTQQNEVNARKVRLIGIWIILASVAYAIMTGMLYLVSFSEYEAKMLASYARYLSTMMVADYLLLVLIIFAFLNDSLKRIYSLLFVVILENIVLFLDIEQLLPGRFVGEERLYNSEIEAIDKYLQDNDSVLIVTYGSNGFEGIVLQYYCTPKNIGYLSVGKNGEDDIWGQEIEVSQFVEKVNEFDYIYIFNIPSSFYADYDTAFEDVSLIQEYRLYRIDIDGGVIVLTDVARE